MGFIYLPCPSPTMWTYSKLCCFISCAIVGYTCDSGTWVLHIYTFLLLFSHTKSSTYIIIYLSSQFLAVKSALTHPTSDCRRPSKKPPICPINWPPWSSRRPNPCWPVPPSGSRSGGCFVHWKMGGFQSISHTGWCPPVISWFIYPINYSYIYHKP